LERLNILLILLCLVARKIHSVPLYLVDHFCTTVGARIDLRKEGVHIKCAGEELSFNFSKFTNKHIDRKYHGKDQIETLASIAIASSDVVE
jgi:hypothetical protein